MNNKKELHNEIDARLSILYIDCKETNLNDEEFSKKFFYKAEMLVNLIKEYTGKKSYNHLTNYNYHFLVKILNYNGFFKGDLSQKLSEELKKFKIII